MKKFIRLFAALVVVIIGIGCDDQVNPKTELKEVYVLNCIIRGDTTYQTATLTKSYNISGFDPYENEIDPAVYGAKLKLIYKGQIYYFRDTIIARNQNSRYKTPLHFYYLKNFRPGENQQVKIEAELPDGKKLFAFSETFAINFVYFEGLVEAIPSLGIKKERIFFNWQNLNNPTSDIALYYAPELVIFYNKEENGIKKHFQKKVPSYYVHGINGTFPVYPPVLANMKSVTFDTSAINVVLKEISLNDPNKENYTIEKAAFRLLILDKNLAVYYSAQRTFLDEFSVRFSQPEFSNIENGLGIFGTYAVKQDSIPFRQELLSKFGYKGGI